jgi:hypothetical protein
MPVRAGEPVRETLATTETTENLTGR